MPILQNPRHEAFAQARAKGVRLEDAYEDAGFAPGHKHASRLALRFEVAQRITELRAANTALEEANPAAMIAALLALAKASAERAEGAGAREARLAIIDVCRLRDEAAQRRDEERRRVEEMWDYEYIIKAYERAERRAATPIDAAEPPAARLAPAAETHENRQPTAI